MRSTKLARATVVTFVVGAAVLAGVGTSTAASASADEPADAESTPAFVVTLHADGSATVMLRYTFDLDSDASAFDQLQTDAETRSDTRERFETRLRRVARNAGNETGREMVVSNGTIDIRETNATGVVELRAAWLGLAAVDGERVVVTEPFASGFEPDRPFTLAAPSGYAFDATSPAPDRTGDGRITWLPDTGLGGFEVAAVPEATPTATPTPTPTATPTPEATATPTDTPTATGEATDTEASTDGRGDEVTATNGPGFGVGAAAAALALLAALTVRGTRRR